MSTLERSSGTSRRREPLSVCLRSVAVLAALTPILTGCVVTDTIEFEAAVNHPFKIISVSPENDHIVTFCESDDEHEFRVTVWDPDKRDETTIHGQVDLRDSATAGGKWYTWFREECHAAVDSSSGDDQEPGIRVELTCAFDYDFKPGERMLRVHISDLGFVDSNPAPNAHTAESMWTINVLPAYLCGDGTK